MSVNTESIKPGIKIDINRSDGRVHSAVIVDWGKSVSTVMVEWSEKNETKGKEVSVESILAMNPGLRVCTDQPSAALDDASIIDENEEDIFADVRVAPAATKKRRQTLLVHQPAQNLLRQVAPPPSRAVTAPRRSVIPPIVSRTLSRTREPADNKLNKTTRNEKEREDGRPGSEQVKKAREVVEPGHPNYKIFSMIADFQATVDFRPLTMTDVVSDSKITVCVRSRGLNSKEIAKKEIEVVTIPNKDHLVLHQPLLKVDLTKYLENHTFRFDYTFNETSSNHMVYKFTAQPLVRTIFEKGFATCFAYGQTGSGKTHTMGGDFAGRSQDARSGIYALTAADVFKLRNGVYAKYKLDVSCAFFEIYGSKVFDLLNNKIMLKVLEDGKGQVNVVGLQETVVETETDVLSLIRKGTEVRTAGATAANANSSRSHAVFQIILRKKGMQWGKFSLIDLAGNERGADTGYANQQTRLEGAEINKSLLALKECIRAMARNSSHVPFRTSKLTMVLRDSFMGENAKTCMIAMVSPGSSSCEHTLNTLRYADRVKELGAEETGLSKPLNETDIFIPVTNGSDDEDFAFMCRKNGQDPRQYKILEEITKVEEITIAKQMEATMAMRKALEQQETQLKKSAQPDYDQEQYAKDLAAHCHAMISTYSDLLANANEWEAAMKNLDINPRQ